MVPMGTNNDAWIAAVASYVRTSFGNAGGFVTPAEVARVRAETASRKTPWTMPELEASLPRRVEPDPSWKATASHNSGGRGDGVADGHLEFRRAAGARHVVPGRAAAAGDVDGD